MSSFDPIVTDASDFDLPQASNDPLPPTGMAFSLDSANVPLESGSEDYGTVKWRTLINGNDQVSREFVLGIAEFGPGDTLLPHRHTAAEFYLGISGTGIVTIDAEDHVMAPGVAIYIPSDAEHSVLAGDDGLRFTYGFAESAFENVTYRFSVA